MRRQHAKSVDERESVHMAFVRDAQNQSSTHFISAREKSMGRTRPRAIRVSESGRLDRQIDGLFERPLIRVLDDVLAGRHLITIPETPQSSARFTSSTMQREKAKIWDRVFASRFP